MTTPNMNLTLPVVSTTPGPAWANQINADLALIDAHNHTSGAGALIPTAGLFIDDNLSFGNHAATQLLCSQYYDAGGVAPNFVSSTYVSNGDLYFKNGAGTPVAITSGNSIVGAAGNIIGLTGTQAQVAYDNGTGTFTFTKYTPSGAKGSIAAASVSVNSGIALTSSVTIAAASNTTPWTLTLPTSPSIAVPGLFGISTTGIGSTVVPDSTLTLTGSQISVASLGIQTANIASGAVTTPKIANGAITPAKLTPVNVGLGSAVSSFVVIGNAGWLPVTGATVSITASSTRPIVVVLSASTEGSSVSSINGPLDLRLHVTGGTTGYYSIGRVGVILGAGGNATVSVPPSGFQLFFAPSSIASYTFALEARSAFSGGLIENVYLIAYQL